MSGGRTATRAIPAEPGDRSRRALRGWLLLVLLLAALLRYPAIYYGNPVGELRNDEGITRRLVWSVLQSGSWDTRHHIWPNLNVYLSVGAIRATRAVCALAGWPPPADAYVGRGLAATCGVLAVWLLYLAGARLYGPRVGLLAAAVLALAPLHLERSRRWLTEAPTTLFYTLALWLAARILARPSVGHYLAAGVAIGLATASKYNGVAAAFPVVVATLVADWPGGVRRELPRRLARLALAGVVSVAIFFLADPYAWLHFAKLRADLAWVTGLYAAAPPTGPLGYHAIRFVLARLWDWGLGPLATVLSLAGLGMLAGRGRWPPALVGWAPLGLYILAYNSNLRLPLLRNFTLVLPHLALGAAWALSAAARAGERVASRFRPGLRLADGLAVGTLCLLLPAAAGETWQARQPDTRDAAWLWMHLELPPGARVFREWPVSPLDRDRFHSNTRRGDVGTLPLRDLLGGTDFVVVASDAYENFIGQRHRPGYDVMAASYDVLFASGSFTQVARFAPGLDAAGPDIRVYRNQASRAPSVGPGCVDLWDYATVNSRALDRQPRADLTFSTAWDILAGSVVVSEPGRYRLRFEAEAAEPFPLEVGIGRWVRRRWIEGRVPVAVDVDLPGGLVFWRLATGNGWTAGRRLRIQRPTLEPLPPG